VAYLIDTSVLARLANAADVRYAIADRAVMELHRRGEVLHLTPQVLVEFWNVATRPLAVNGLGLSRWRDLGLVLSSLIPRTCEASAALCNASNCEAMS